MNEKDNVIETRTEKIWSEDGIVHCVNKAVNDHTLEDAMENVAAANKASNGLPYLMMVDIRKCKRITIEARKYYVSKENKNVLACAFVISSPVSYMIGKMFLGINRPSSFPLELMRSEEKAIQWLRQQREGQISF